MSSPLSKLTFLVLDDNPNMTQIMRVVLKGFGVDRICEAGSVADAFEIARRQDLDMAFVDYNLGGMDGLAFLKLMRTAADSPNPHLPMVMLSAYSEQHRVESARDAGAHDFLVKPVTPIEVYRKVLDAIERPRPFIRSETFFGPDRRRREDAFYAGPERRRQVEPPAVDADGGAAVESGESKRRGAVTADADAA